MPFNSHAVRHRDVAASKLECCTGAYYINLVNRRQNETKRFRLRQMFYDNDLAFVGGGMQYIVRKSRSYSCNYARECSLLAYHSEMCAPLHRIRFLDRIDLHTIHLYIIIDGIECCMLLWAALHFYSNVSTIEHFSDKRTLHLPNIDPGTGQNTLLCTGGVELRGYGVLYYIDATCVRVHAIASDGIPACVSAFRIRITGLQYIRIECNKICPLKCTRNRLQLNNI